MYIYIYLHIYHLYVCIYIYISTHKTPNHFVHAPLAFSRLCRGQRSDPKLVFAAAPSSTNRRKNTAQQQISLIPPPHTAETISSMINAIAQTHKTHLRDRGLSRWLHAVRLERCPNNPLHSLFYGNDMAAASDEPAILAPFITSHCRLLP